jgi:preprotein translocase subunit SecG
VTTTTATPITATSITTTTTRTPEPFAQCETKVQWMQTYWNSQWGNEVSYRANGVDGSEASIRAYLGNVEHFCPAATTTTVSATDATATSTTTTTFTFEHTTTTTTEAPTTVEPTVIATTTNAPTSVTTTAASTSIGHTTKLKVLINGKVDELLTASSNSASNNDNAVAAGVDNTMTDPIVVVLGTLFVLGCLVVGAVVVKKQRKLSQHTITTDVEAAIPHRSLDNINYCMATSTTTTSGSTYDCVASVEEQMNGLPHYNTAA